MGRATRARTVAIVVAAGQGERFGAPKQFLAVGNQRLVDRAVAVAGAACDEVVLVLPEGRVWDGAPVAGRAEYENSDFDEDTGHSVSRRSFGGCDVDPG